MKKENKLIKQLTNSVSEKIDNKKEMTNVNDMYGIFLKNNNNFIICNEKKFRSSDEPHLSEFFTDTVVDFPEVRFNKTIFPWREGGKILMYGNQYLGLAFCVPIRDLLGKYIIDGECNKKYISELYASVNEYLIENPNFVQELLEGKKEKTR